MRKDELHHLSTTGKLGGGGGGGGGEDEAEGEKRKLMIDSLAANINIENESSIISTSRGLSSLERYGRQFCEARHVITMRSLNSL